MAEYNHEHSINDTGLETLGKYTTRKSPSLRCNAPCHYSPSHESFITSTYVPHQFITGEQTNSFRHRSAASLCISSRNVFGEESRYRLCLQAHITSFLLTRNHVWFFTGTPVITFRNPWCDFLQTAEGLATCSWQTKDLPLFHQKENDCNQPRANTFPVHSAQSAYLIKNSRNKAFLKKSRWQTISYLRSALIRKPSRQCMPFKRIRHWNISRANRIYSTVSIHVFLRSSFVRPSACVRVTCIWSISWSLKFGVFSNICRHILILFKIG